MGKKDEKSTCGVEQTQNKASNNERLLFVALLIKDHPGITRDELLRYLLVERDGRYAMNPDTLSAILDALCKEGILERKRERRQGETSPFNHYRFKQELSPEMAGKLLNAICCSYLLSDKDKQLLIRYMQKEYLMHGLPGVGYAYVGSEQESSKVVTLLQGAIAANRKITVSVCGYDRAMNLIELRRATVDPCAVVYYENRSYLFCGEMGKLCFLRIDLLKDVEVLEEEATQSLEGQRLFRREVIYSSTQDIPLNLGRFLKDHVRSRDSEPVEATLRIYGEDNDRIYTYLKDAFETWQMTSEGNILVRSTEELVTSFALQHCQCVELLQPEDLRKSVRKTLKESAKRYR